MFLRSLRTWYNVFWSYSSMLCSSSSQAHPDPTHSPLVCPFLFFFYTHQVWLALTINCWLCELPLQLPSWRKLTVPLLAARLRVGLHAHLLSPCWHLGFHRSHACCHNLCEFVWTAALLSPYCHLLPLALILLILVSYDTMIDIFVYFRFLCTFCMYTCWFWFCF